MRFLLISFLIFTLSFSAFAQSNKGGKPIADIFTASSLDGTVYDLSEMRGKVVIVTFWSTRCSICAAEIPKLNVLAENYRDKEVVFLGLTTDSEGKVKDFLRKKPFNFKILPNSFGILLKYADKDGDGNVTMGYPTHYLINQKGEIELKTSGFDKSSTLDSNINRLLRSGHR